MKNPVVVTILGCRGSVPVCGEQFTRYGGSTSCVLVRSGDSIAILDAGTGLLKLAPHLNEERSIPVFLTHGHVDHILGLPLCPPALSSEYQFHVYGTVHSGQDTSAQLCALMSPPLWPVSPSQLPAQFFFHSTAPRLELGSFTVDTLVGCHPGGVTIYRLTVNDRSIIYMTDCTITDENRSALLEFSRNCDLLLCDGQYSDAEWHTRATFGHNRWTEAARFGTECGAKKIRIVHHDPTHSDSTLDTARTEVRTITPACDLAFDNEEIIL